MVMERGERKWPNINNGKIMPGKLWFRWCLEILQNSVPTHQHFSKSPPKTYSVEMIRFMLTVFSMVRDHLYLFANYLHDCIHHMAQYYRRGFREAASFRFPFPRRRNPQLEACFLLVFSLWNYKTWSKGLITCVQLHHDPVSCYSVRSEKKVCSEDGPGYCSRIYGTKSCLHSTELP